VARSLNTGNPATVQAFANAVAELVAASILLDAPTGAFQHVEKDRRIPVGGGAAAEAGRSP
jgi:hypothetical protein